MFSSNIGSYEGYGGGYGGYDPLGAGGYDSQPANVFDTPGPDKQSRKRGLPGKAVDGVMPCMIGQLLAANEAKSGPDDNLIINGRECNQVTVVGRIESKEVQNMSVSLTISDRSGQLSVKKYLDGEDAKYNTDEFSEGRYIRVVGMLRHQGFVSAFGMNPIQSPNEVLYHEAECVYVHCCLMEQDGATNLDFSCAPSAKPYASQAPYTSQAQFGNQGGGGGASIEEDKSKLEGLLLKENKPLGLTPQDMSSRLGVDISRVHKALKSLEDDGMVFETKAGCYNHVEACSDM